jgi:AraC-like DNA-binding protein
LSSEYAKSLILDPNYANITLEAIGNTAGFGSRTTFFNAFKKFEGISPSDFLKTIDHSTGSTKF